MRRVAAAIAVAMIAAGCGGEAGDLLAIEVSGGFQREAVRLTVTSDGRARCDAGELKPLPSERVIKAREIERELTPLAEDAASFGEPSAERRGYVARMRAGTVRWAEGELGLPPILAEAVLFARDLQRDVCPAS